MRLGNHQLADIAIASVSQLLSLGAIDIREQVKPGVPAASPCC